MQSDLSKSTWLKFYRLNNYYHKEVEKIIKFLVPQDASVIEVGVKGGETLSSLPNKEKTGITLNNNLIELAQKNLGKNRVYNFSNFPKNIMKKFDYAVLNHSLSDIDDAQLLIKNLKKVIHEDSRIVVTYFNFFWKPLLDLTEKIGLRLPQTKEPNWLTQSDVDNFFYLENFESVKSGKIFLFPYQIPLISTFINKYLSKLPGINWLCFTNYSVYRQILKRKDYSVSIVIPARNEEGNMRGIFKKIPKLGKGMDIIFIEGHSKDKTYIVIEEEIKRYKGSMKPRLYKQKGKGKGDAVRLGFAKAKNELLMILDADLTVDPKELTKFYEAAAQGKGDLIMGSRLVYPMERQAMRLLNYLGNKFFSVTFTFLLGQRIKDTLCGTKVLLKENYKKIEGNRHVFGNFDPFGDFDLIFGASKLNFKIVEIPIRYKERVYGKTNISRFTHGFLLLKMVLFAAKNLKFI